jgi:hypothetical protein
VTVLSKFRLYRRLNVNLDELKPTDSFHVIEVPPLDVKSDGVKEYLDYKRTGGPDIDVWERYLDELNDSGELASIEADYYAEQPR